MNILNDPVREDLPFLHFSVEQAPDAIFWMDFHGLCQRANDTGCRWLAYSKKELQSMPMVEIFPDSQKADWSARWEGVTNGRPETLETHLRTKDGRFLPVEVSFNSFTVNGKGYVCAFVRDISERRRCADAISQFRRHNDLILNAAGEGIFGLDLEGNHTFVNPTATQLLGYEPGELLGKPSHVTWHHTKTDGSPYPAEECPIYRAYKDGQVHTGDDEVFWRKDGTSFPAQYTSTPIWDDQGALAGAVVTFQDMTEKKEIAARLLEEAKLAEVTRVLGDIGHDIKNMLMPVLSGADLVKDELNEQFPQLVQAKAKGAERSYANSLDLLKMIDTNARRIHDRVREIADAVKGVTSPPNFASCEIAKIVEEVYETLRTYAGEKGISLNTSDVESLPIIEADERRLFNALYNLVNNAIPEVPSGGSVTIRGGGKTPQGMVEFVVEDTGGGMPSDIRDRLFTPRVVSTKSTGTGLGTKIVKDVIDLHQGHIRVESEQGKGTSFYIQLPMMQTEATHTSF